MSLLLTHFRTAHAELSPLLPEQAVTLHPHATKLADAGEQGQEREREREQNTERLSTAAPMEMFPLYQRV